MARENFSSRSLHAALLQAAANQRAAARPEAGWAWLQTQDVSEEGIQSVMAGRERDGNFPKEWKASRLREGLKPAGPGVKAAVF